MSRRLEFSVFGIGIAVLILFQLTITRTFDLFTHPLWLDEIITYLITNDPSFTHAMSAIRSGADTNPPTFYLLLWPIARLSGGLNEVGLRVVSLTSVWIAIVGSYCICRRFFGRSASVAGALALWTHPLVMEQAFEARFYGPWLALTIWYSACLLGASDRESTSKVLLRSLLAVALATVHWFGIISLVLIQVTDTLARRDFQLRRAAPFLCGCLATVLCAPFLFGQREGLSVKTWIDPPTLSIVKRMLVLLFGSTAMITVAAIGSLGRLYFGSTPHPERRGLIPFAALVAFFPLLVVFSYVVQPALVDRYLIVSIAPLCVVATVMLQDCPRRLLNVTICVLVAVGAAELIGAARRGRGLRHDLEQLLVSVDAARRELPGTMLLFKRRHDLYPLVRLRPDLLEQSALLDFPDKIPVSPLARYERDMGRKIANAYPILRVTPSDSVTSLGQPILIVRPADERTETEEILHAFRLRKFDEWVDEAEPKSR